MNRKILSVAALALVSTLSIPLAQADRDGYRDGYRYGGRDEYREVRVQRVERYYNRDDDREYRHDRGWHRGWYRHRSHERYERDEYHAPPPPRAYREDYPVRRASSPVPILAGSVIGGVVGHSVSRGDPGDTAVGAVIGTIIGYEIVRNRDY